MDYSEGAPPEAAEAAVDLRQRSHVDDAPEEEEEDTDEVGGGCWAYCCAFFLFAWFAAS